MASVIKGIYIDVNKSVEVRIKIDGKNLDFDLVYPKEKENNIGFRNYINNIRKMLKVDYRINKDNVVDAIEVSLGRFKLGEVSSYQLFGIVDSNAKYIGYHYLNTSEERILSQGNFENIEELGVPFERKTTGSPKTDLHTHLSGALTSDDIIYIAKKFNTHIDISILEKAGIDINKYEDKFDYIDAKDKNGKSIKIARLAFNYLDESDVEIYKFRLSIGINSQETFSAMEDCYSFRHPVVRLGGNAYDKSVSIEELFKEQLRCLARHYQKTGVKYAELSMSEICKDPAKFLKIIDNVMPDIKKEFPDVTLRFLGAIPRNLNKAELALRNKNLLAAANNPYVAGLDIMAHEINQTKHFGEVITECLEYADKNDPNFVIRVHAGESDVHYDNVKQFLQIVNDYVEKTKNQPPVIRIGHGIHGFDDETIDLAVKLGVIIEINLSSNLALNNVDSVTHVLLKKYKERGLRVVISTDGHGMYSTDSHQEAELAVASGFTAKDIDDMNKDEEEYIKKASQTVKNQNLEDSKNKVEYLAELVDNVRFILNEASLSVEDIKKYSKKDAASLIYNLMINSKVGKINALNEDEWVLIIKKGILKYDGKSIKNLPAWELLSITDNMPNEYYMLNHSVSEQEYVDLKTKSTKYEQGQDVNLRMKQKEFKRFMRGGGHYVEVYDQDHQIPSRGYMTPLCLIGYIDSEWDALSPDARKEIITEATELVASLDPTKTFLITSTAKEGFNEILIEIIKRHNPKLLVMGLLNEAQLKNMQEDELRWIKYSFDIVKIEKGNQFEYSTELADYLKHKNGRLVAFGDGAHLKDHIINLHNRGGNIHLYSGKYSGSSKVDFLRGNGYEFADSQELLDSLGLKSKLTPEMLSRTLNYFESRILDANSKQKYKH